MLAIGLDSLLASISDRQYSYHRVRTTEIVVLSHQIFCFRSCRDKLRKKGHAPKINNQNPNLKSMLVCLHHDRQSPISRHGGTLGWLWNLRSGVDNGGQRTQLYLIHLAHRLSARPDPARRAGATTRLGTGDPEPVKQVTTPRAALSSRDPRARVVPRSGPTSSPGNCHIPRLGPVSSRHTWLSV